MKITGYRTLSTRHSWGRAVGDSNGWIADAVTEVPILLIDTDEGVTGIGLGQHADIARVFAAIEGEDPRAVSALYDRMLAQVFKTGHQGGTFGAIGAVDMALWDIKAKLADQPLWRLLGGRDRFVPGYASGLDAGLDNGTLSGVYSDFAERGFRSAKVKVGVDAASDLERLRMVSEILAPRAAGAPRGAMMVDANEAWSAKEAIRHVAALEAHLDLAWVEEPVRRWDVAGHRIVRDGIKAAVASGENYTGLEQFRPLIEAGGVDVVQTGSVWGITHFLRVAAYAHANDLSVSPVGYHTNPLAAACTAVPNSVGIEVQNLTEPLGISVDHQVEGGGLVLGDEPGAGLTVDVAAIEAVAASAWGAKAGPHVRPQRAGLGHLTSRTVTTS